RQVDLLGDSHDPGEVATRPDDGRIDDRVVTGGGEFGQPLDGGGDRGVFVPLVVVCVDVGREDEHVLVHERAAERGRVDDAGGGRYVGHDDDPIATLGRCFPSTACWSSRSTKRWPRRSRLGTWPTS